MPETRAYNIHPRVTKVAFGGYAHIPFLSKGLCFLTHEDVKSHMLTCLRHCDKIPEGGVCLGHCEEGAAHLGGGSAKVLPTSRIRLPMSVNLI